MPERRRGDVATSRNCLEAPPWPTNQDFYLAAVHMLGCHGLTRAAFCLDEPSDHGRIGSWPILKS